MMVELITLPTMGAAKALQTHFHSYAMEDVELDECLSIVNGGVFAYLTPETPGLADMLSPVDGRYRFKPDEEAVHRQEVLRLVTTIMEPVHRRKKELESGIPNMVSWLEVEHMDAHPLYLSLHVVSMGDAAVQEFNNVGRGMAVPQVMLTDPMPFNIEDLAWFN